VLNKVGSEFVDAATQAAVAIVEGLIPVINPMDPGACYSCGRLIVSARRFSNSTK
jgi:hypothetical protein